jgi:hypothetical protein
VRQCSVRQALRQPEAPEALAGWAASHTPYFEWSNGELSSGMQWRMNAGLDFNDEKVINKCYPVVARHHERASLLTERSHCGAPRGAGGCAVLMGKV